jgi:hypothetical protein
MQLAANIYFGRENSDNSCLYIGKKLVLNPKDCEGSFVASRIKQIALASSHILQVPLTNLLSSITIWRPSNQGDFIEMIKSLPDQVKANPACRLVVIDSVAFFFRSFNGDYSERTRLLAWIAQILRRTAQLYQIAV